MSARIYKGGRGCLTVVLFVRKIHFPRLHLKLIMAKPLPVALSLSAYTLNQYTIPIQKYGHPRQVRTQADKWIESAYIYDDEENMALNAISLKNNLIS